MAAEVSADLTLIQDEDVLRRMWADTEDLGRKKEIRARMYRLREQRLKDFYTTGEVVSEITGRKHATTTHTESIGDQGFLTMKSKEIRDSESPTRDFSRRAIGNGNGYWQSVEERGHTTGNQDGTAIERSEESRRGEGVVVEGNAETRMALSAQNIHEKTSKSDDNMSVKSETNQQSQKFASVTESDDKSSRKETSESQDSKSFHEEKTSHTTSGSTKISSTTSSSSRKVVSSSVTSARYEIVDGQKRLIDSSVRAITSGDDYNNSGSNLRSDETNVQSNRQTSTVLHDETDNTRFRQPEERLIRDTQDVNVTKSQQTSHDSKHHQSERTNESYNTVQHYTTNYSTTVENDGNDTYIIENENRHRPVDSRSDITETVVKDSSTRNETNIKKNKNTHHEEVSRNQQKETSDSNEYITNERIDSSTFDRSTPRSVSQTPVNEVVERYTTVREVSNNARDSTINQTQVHSNTDQKIMNEINKLDTYLQHQNTPVSSEPATPRTVTDGAQWTVVSNRDGEFEYQNDNSPRDSTPQYSQAPREQPIKHPSSLDLPKDATDGQYVTTYQQSYNRISVDNSPSHEFFVRTLRASPDRLTPSPTKSSRGSLDRNSPDRRLRASKGSLDRSSPETSKRRSVSKGSLDRSTPDRTYRTSKTPDRERRGSTESYTIDRKKDVRRKTTEITQQMVKDSNKPRRKFSSTQQKAANKTRVSTPGVSPSTSPTRTVKKEVTSGSESDISQATYNKTSSISSFRDENIVITKTDKKDTIEQVDKNDTTVLKKSLPREKSPEYSSEGSVSREINKSLASRSELTTSNNSFKPIKNSPNEDTTDNFILEEQKNVVRENEIIETSDTRKQVSKEGVIRNDTIEITDVTHRDSDSRHIVVHPDDSDDQCKLTKNQVITEKTVVEERSVTERSNKGKSPTSSPERRPKETKKPGTELNHSKYPEDVKTNVTKPKTSSPERKPSDRQPLKPLNQKRPSDTPSTERNPKTSQHRPSDNRRPDRPSPERRQPSSRTPERDTKRKSFDENRRSISSSPERRLTPKTSVKTNQTASSTFISEETKTQTRERSVSSSPERRPTKQAPKTSPKSTDKSPSGRQQRPSPSPSPERISPERKVKPSQTRREHTSYNHQTPTATPTNQRVQKTTTKETVRTTRYSSIPRANKLSPRNSKDKIEPTNNKAPNQIIRKATPIPRSIPTTRVSSVTRVSRITEQRQEIKSSPARPTNVARKPIETIPKRTPSKIATPKSTPNKPKSAETPNNKPTTQRIPRLSDSPQKNTINKRTTQTPTNKKVIRNEIEISEITVTNKTKNENEDFLKKERSLLDLEDENPPEEFYAEYDDRTDDTSPERQPKSKRVVDDVTPITTKTVKTKEIKKESPKPKSSLKPVPKVSKTKPESNQTETISSNKKIQNIRETNKTRKTSRKLKTERKSSKDYVSSSSSSSSEEEDIEPNQVPENHNRNLTENDQVTHESIQDLLTVVVQHPKSSRESSPGYPSGNPPFCTTSEDGDSNPRYADFVTEPDDVENFDGHRGPATPIRLTEDETVDVRSVADRVNVFLEATRVTQETVHQPEPVVSSPKSVLKAKTMFENIAKNQISGNQNPDKVSKSPNTQNHSPDKKTAPKKPTHDDVSITEEIVEEDVSKSFIEKEIYSQEQITDDESTIVHQSKVNEKQPTDTSKRPSIASVDVTSKKDYFERRTQDEVEILDEINDVKRHVVREVIDKETIDAPIRPEDTAPKRIISERKSPSPQRESPKNVSNTVTSVTKKTTEKKVSTTVGAKKKIFENTTDETEIKENINNTYHPENTTPKRSVNKQKSPSPQRQLPKTLDSKKRHSIENTTEDIDINETVKVSYRPEDSTPKRSVTKQKSPSPQRQSPKTNISPENKKPVDKKSSTIVGAKKRLFENTTEEVEIKETIKSHQHEDKTPQRNVTKQKSPSPQRQPSKPLNATPDTKKPTERKPSIVGTRKQSFERTTEEVNIVESRNIRNSVEDSAIRKQNSQTDITKRRPSLKEKSPSPQRNVPKQKETPESKKPFERKKSGPTVDVSSKKDFFEKKVKDISIAASKTKPQKPTSINSSRPRSDSPETSTRTTEQTFTDRLVRTQSPEKHELHRQTDEEEEFSETTRKVSHSQEVKQTFSKTEQLIRKISESDQSDRLIKSEITYQRPLETEQPTKKPSKPESFERKPTKPEEIVRKTSKPQEIVHSPSKPDGTVDSRTYNRNEYSTRTTTTSSLRGQTPDRQPEEIVRKFSRPEEITRKPSKPEEITRKLSKTEEITRKTSKPAEVIRKPSKTEDEQTTKPEEIVRRPSSRTESYMRSTISSTRSHTPDYQTNEIIRKTPKSESPDYKPSKDSPRTPSRLDYNEADVTDEVETHQTVTESSYMRSTVSSSGRGQTPEKQFRGSTPERNTQNRPRSPLKSDPRRRPSEPEEVLEETATRRTSIRTETKQEVGGKFGVTLRKTPSSGKMATKPTIQRQNSRPADIDIESIFDLELLEEMLLKAVGYDDRRRIRAQIRLVKKQIEDEKNATITTKTTKSTSSIQSTLPSVRDIKRQTSPSKSPERQEHVRSSPRSSPERRPSHRSPAASPERRQHTYSSPRASPERRERVQASPRASPERFVKASSPEKQSSDRTTTRKYSTEKTTNGYTESRTVTERTTVRTQSVRKSTSSDVKETCPTDLITSSYGVGPTDENGKPLFGLRALRRTSTNKTLIDDNVEHEIVTQEEEESSLFGLKALQTTEKMPAESSQLRELVERHQQYVRQSSAKDLQPVQKPKAKLRDSFILTQDENATPVLQSGTEEIPKGGLSLKSIIQKHENKNGSNIQSSMESKSTVVKSRSTVTSDGKVSLHRDVIHGEVSSKNNEEPVGKITRSSYSYQSPKDKDSLPNVTSSTTTSLIGNRRSSGPKIEEITDGTDSTYDANRRYSKEYTVEEDETVDRRSSTVSVEGNVKTYTSILKNSGESGRRPSGPRITDVSDVNSEQERRTSITKTVSSRVSPDIAEVKSASSNRQQSFKNEENKTETQKKVITRGDSVKALQHKFQQATEAANQPSSRPYPRAGLILRSNTLQQIDDQTQMSSSMKHSSVERTSSKSKQEMKETKETKSHDVSSSPVLKTEVVTHQDTEVVRSVQDSRSDEPTSFLDNRTKVTGVQDILTRMRNADLVTEKTDSNEDAEARALLNKFLGASVILQGMEQGMRAAQIQPETIEGSPASPASAALVIQAEKQRVKATAVRTVEDDIDEIHDEKQLRILLDACSDYEGRRKLRARLRTIMAEQKGGPEDVEESHESSESTSEVVRKGDAIVKTEVHTRTTSSSARLTKANSVQSPFAKFRQLERQNSAPSAGRPPPLFKFTEPKLAQSASTIKERLLSWVQAQTRHYKNIKIENFSTSWSSGLAFCALIHHFCPHAFDYDSLTPEKRRYNFELAFRVAEEEADIFPLLDVEDMVVIKKPDWKCVFTYVQSIYRRFHDSPDALPVF